MSHETINLEVRRSKIESREAKDDTCRPGHHSQLTPLDRVGFVQRLKPRGQTKLDSRCQNFGLGLGLATSGLGLGLTSGPFDLDRGGATVLKVGGTIFFDPPTFWPVGGDKILLR